MDCYFIVLGEEVFKSGFIITKQCAQCTFMYSVYLLITLFSTEKPRWSNLRPASIVMPKCFTLVDGQTVAPFIFMHILLFSLVPRSINWNLDGLATGLFDSNHSIAGHRSSSRSIIILSKLVPQA